MRARKNNCNFESQCFPRKKNVPREEAAETTADPDESAVTISYTGLMYIPLYTNSRVPPRNGGVLSSYMTGEIKTDPGRNPISTRDSSTHTNSGRGMVLSNHASCLSEHCRSFMNSISQHMYMPPRSLYGLAMTFTDPSLST